jgi:NAD(P)H-flavin reductase
MMGTTAPNPYLATPMRIVSVTRELPEVFSWELATPAPFGFRPGQFNMIYRHGVGEVPISISGALGAPARLVHTIRAVGAVTRAMERLEAGDAVLVRGPYGAGWPLAEAAGRDVVVVAGGLGLAPLRPAILDLLARRDELAGLTIIAGARTPEALLYRDELTRWRARFDVEVEVTVDRADRDWFGPVGVVTRPVAEVRLEPARVLALVCGPEIMMRFVLRELERRGVRPDQVWLSLERSMKCGVGLCGHCQLGGGFVCTDGPVYRADRVGRLLTVREL